MRHRSYSLTAVGLLLGVLGLMSPAGAAADPPRAQLRAFDCQPALNPPDRRLATRAVMRPLPGTQKLELKFDLLVTRPGSSGASAVRAGDLGVWFSPKDPTLGQLPGDVWNFDKSVVELDAPAIYRFRVAFRWIGANGQVIGSAVHYSRRCRQRELRPDLLFTGPIGVAPVPGSPGMDTYTAVISNAGATAAGPFVVEFVPGVGSPVDATAQTDTVSRLGPSEQRTESFTGPACATAGPPTIILDSAAQVDDLNRANNTMTAVCPPTAPAGGFSSSRYTR